MKNKAMGTMGLLLAIAFMAILITSTNSVSAGTTGTHNVTLSVGASAPVVVYVAKTPSGSVDPTAGGTTNVISEIHVQEANGQASIGNVNMTYWLAGQTNRTNSSCAYVSDLGSNIFNYTCKANMYFYDLGGSWIITAYANDTSGDVAVNSTQTFTYNNLQDINVSLTNMTFGTITLGGINATASNNPQVITNRGNVAINSVNVTAYNLNFSTNTIIAGNFTVQNITNGCMGNAMSNAASKLVSGVTVPVGASSQSSMYYCIPSVPSGLVNGAYSANSNWVVTSVS